jgi:enterochelin esterase-like enzyme
MRRTVLALGFAGFLAVGVSAAYASLDVSPPPIHSSTALDDSPAPQAPVPTAVAHPRPAIVRRASRTAAPAAGGTLEFVHFYSQAVGHTESYLVYLPPNYAAQARRGRRFGVVYLLHGVPGHDIAFTHHDAIRGAMDSLIARRRVQPMILVMPEGGQGDTEWANAQAGPWMDFVMNVVHDVDQRFATLADRRHRAIAGASEGAYGALNIGLHHVAAFSVIESWSGYYTQYPTGPFSGASPAELRANSPAAYVPSMAPTIRRRGLRVWLLLGQGDWRSPRLLTDFAGELYAAGAEVRYGFFPGSHNWALWRAQTPRLMVAIGRWFRQRPGTQSLTQVG